MRRTTQKFAELLTEGVYRIRLREAKTVQIVQDELGYALGREGGSAVEYWRKGHIPPSLIDVEKLAREIVVRGDLDRPWLERFLQSCSHPYPTFLCDELYPQPETVNQKTNGASPDINPLGKAQDGKSDHNFHWRNLDSFVVGPPVIHPCLFFGREYELKRIFGLWRRLPLQNAAIIGLRRSGKTSLLHYLRHITTTPPSQLRPQQWRDWLTHPKQYRWVLVDFRDPRMCQLEWLLHYLLTSLEIPIMEPCDLKNFMEMVSQHLTSPTIILLDEIGAALSAPSLDMSFWGSLRALATHLTGGNLAFLLTAHDAPALLAQERGKPSPFFNIFGHTFTLGPFTEAEARDLLASSTHPFAPEDVEWILAQSECWPCRLQALAHARLTALEYDQPGDSWKREGLRQMLPY